MYQTPPKRFGVLCDIRAYRWLHTTPEQLLHLRASAEANTFEIFWDQHGRPLGYVVWANVCRESAERLNRNGQFPRYTYEWSEGHICLLLDVVINDVDRKLALRQFKAVLSERKIIVFRRRGEVRLYLKKNGRLRRMKGEQG